MKDTKDYKLMTIDEFAKSKLFYDKENFTYGELSRNMVSTVRKVKKMERRDQVIMLETWVYNERFTKFWNKEVIDEADILEDAYGCYKKDLSLFLEELEKANKGDNKAQYTVGIYFSNLKLIKNDEESKFYINLSAENNYESAKKYLKNLNKNQKEMNQ